MRIEFLGTGGALPTPRPGCACAVCEDARARGVPYRRSGPSLFVHGPDVLVDTPEEIAMQLNRARIMSVPHALYSHWHPDHMMGRRVWEMNIDWDRWPPRHRVTDIYLPQQVAADFRERLGAWEHLAYFEEMGIVRLHVLSDGHSLMLGRTQITPFRLAAPYVYAFLFEGDGKRVLVAPDELVGWQPPDFVRGVDLAIIPKGIQEFDPFTDERRIPADHPLLSTEATFRQTLEIVRQMAPKRVVMTHIEEADRLGYDDLLRLQKRLQSEGLPVTFAHDTLVLDL